MQIENDYFEWIYKMCIRRGWKSYRKLLMKLHSVPFTPVSYIPMDRNRISDGEDLRYKFSYSNNIDRDYVMESLDNRPCSCLEMMAALSIRLGSELLASPDDNNATSKLFMNMLESMDILDLDDKHYDPMQAAAAIDVCFNRQFERDGRGGLFYIPGINRDMRQIEFWYQALWYIDKKY